MFDEDLKRLRAEGLLREVRDRASAQGARVFIGGREYLNFASNDYLGLAAHPALAMAAREALETYGAGAGASRLLSGGTELHAGLERSVAELKGTEDAVLANSGYAANIGILPALCGADDLILSDELNHASIIDGCRLSRAAVRIYPHRDTAALAEMLAAPCSGKKVVVTDSVFSMHGHIAPLPDIARLCEQHGALLYIDDAHATGVLGGGGGSLAHFGIAPQPWIIQMGTFSKALGSFGAFAAASADTVDWIRNTARSFIFSTALPAPVVAASRAALAVIKQEPQRIERLWENRRLLADALLEKGIQTGDSETPIIPVAMRDVAHALSCAERLLEAGIYAPAIRPPTVSEPIIRITVTAAHEPDDLALLVRTLSEAIGEGQIR